MIVNNSNQAAQVTGVKSSKFGFQMNAKTYDILLSKMYTNKPAAVIRELSANAWDAHVDAGKTDTPFDLHLPTWLDKTFYLRDYGTGIPHDKFEDIYTNVGASTKEDSNDFIGGYGLGSKTPFTMTDTFMVENWHEGVKTTWICFKDSGEPNVSLVNTEDSDEPNGIKVSFSFDEGDVPEFVRQVPIQLKFFPVKPNITGGEGKVKYEDLPDDWDTKDYFYLSKDDWQLSRNYVVMGNVCYSLNSSEFDYELRQVFGSGLVIKVPIGAVDIPPSREHLEMTPRTKTYITDILKRIKKEYFEDVQEQVSKCKTEWELRKVIYRMNSSILGNPEDLEWNGEPIEYLNLRKAYLTNIAGYPTKRIEPRYSNVYRSSYIIMQKIVDGEYTYYVNDLGVGGNKYINETYSNHDTKDMAILSVPNSPKNTFDARVKEAQDAVEKEIGSKPLLLSSVFGKPPVPVKKPKGTGDRPATNQVFKLTRDIHEGTSLKHGMVEQDELPKDGYYMELYNWSIVTKIPQIRELIEYGLLQYLDKPVYLVRSKTVGKLDKSMKLLDTKVLQGLRQDLEKEIEERFRLDKLTSHLHRVTDMHKRIIPYLKDPRVRAYVRYSNWVLKKRRYSKGNSLALYKRIFGKDYLPEPEIPKKILALIKMYTPVHEVLSNLCASWSKETNEKRMDNLITLLQENK